MEKTDRSTAALSVANREWRAVLRQTARECFYAVPKFQVQMACREVRRAKNRTRRFERTAALHRDQEPRHPELRGRVPAWWASSAPPAKISSSKRAVRALRDSRPHLRLQP